MQSPPQDSPTITPLDWNDLPPELRLVIKLAAIDGIAVQRHRVQDTMRRLREKIDKLASIGGKSIAIAACQTQLVRLEAKFALYGDAMLVTDRLA